MNHAGPPPGQDETTAAAADADCAQAEPGSACTNVNSNTNVNPSLNPNVNADAKAKSNSGATDVPDVPTPATGSTLSALDPDTASDRAWLDENEQATLLEFSDWDEQIRQTLYVRLPVPATLTAQILERLRQPAKSAALEPYSDKDLKPSEKSASILTPILEIDPANQKWPLGNDWRQPEHQKQEPPAQKFRQRWPLVATLLLALCIGFVGVGYFGLLTRLSGEQLTALSLETVNDLEAASQFSRPTHLPDWLRRLPIHQTTIQVAAGKIAWGWWQQRSVDVYQIQFLDGHRMRRLWVFVLPKLSLNEPIPAQGTMFAEVAATPRHWVLLQPKGDGDVVVAVLSDPDDWQHLKSRLILS